MSVLLTGIGELLTGALPEDDGPEVPLVVERAAVVLEGDRRIDH